MPGTRWRERARGSARLLERFRTICRGLEDALEVNLVVVAAFAIERCRIELARDKEDRHGIGPAFGHASECIGGAGAGCRAHDSGRPTSACVSIGGEGTGLFVANAGRCRSIQAGVRWRHRWSSSVEPGHAKEMTDTMLIRALDQNVSAVCHASPFRLELRKKRSASY